MNLLNGSLEFVEEWVELKAKEYGAKSVFLPAGKTLLPVYKKWSQALPESLKNLSFYQIDEVLDGNEAFAKFFEKNLINVEVIPPSERVNSVDLTLLGFGKNGHVAFHEPDIQRDFEYGEVSLSESTVANLGLELGVRALTYGLGTFVRSKAILLIIRGMGKDEAYEKFLQRDPSIPATWLLHAKDLTVLDARGTEER